MGAGHGCEYSERKAVAVVVVVDWPCASEEKVVVVAAAACFGETCFARDQPCPSEKKVVVVAAATAALAAHAWQSARERPKGHESTGISLIAARLRRL